MLENGVFTDITVPGALSTHVGGANDRGEFVGNYHATDNDPYAPGGPVRLKWPTMTAASLMPTAIVATAPG